MNKTRWPGDDDDDDLHVEHRAIIHHPTHQTDTQTPTKRNTTKCEMFDNGGNGICI